jgi:hypothetical protein
MGKRDKLRKLSLRCIMGFLRGVCIMLALVIALTVVAIAWAVSICFRRASAYYAKYEVMRFSRALVSDAYFAMKAGDLVFFVAATHGFTNSMLTGEFFSHGGIVVEHAGVLYLSEALGNSAVAKGAAGDIRAAPFSRLSPLLSRLKNYCGSAYWVALDTAVTADQGASLWRAAQIRHPYPSALQVIAGILGFKTESRHCFQHVAWMLDQAGLAPDLPKKLEDEGFLGTARAVLALPGASLQNGAQYLQPRFLLYDLDAGPSISG